LLRLATMTNNTPPPKDKKIIIQGVTPDGQQFRPSDWAERMSGQLSTFKNRRMTYSPLLQPVIKEGYKCVVLDPKLRESNPELYASILDFAQHNNLKICDEEGN
jgi:hypothetical protein